MGITRRSLLGIAMGTAAVRVAGAQGAPPAPIAYQTMANTKVMLRPYLGRSVALLIDPARKVDAAVAGRIVAAFDRAWEWYRGYFDRTPHPYKSHAGKVTIAEVPTPHVTDSFAGIELLASTTTLLLTEAIRDRYNQAGFFIMGRNFCDYDTPLGPISAFKLGFANLHRFYAIEGAGVTGAPWDENLDFDHYRRSIVVDMLDRYLADHALTWENTLAANSAPTNPNGWGAGELAAGFFHRIRRDHGQEGYRRFWRLMRDAPNATTPKEAASRFVQIARVATGADYRDLFKDQTLPLVF